MTIFSLEFARLPDVIAGGFSRWRRGHCGPCLQDLNERTLADIGLAEPLRRDLDAVKPFWMP
ncbi:MAG TPA: hypothetical protein VMC05_11095 [Xanthobacteraceae bacterium]|nr:hypothetical protein [Xanthobacteraceae bacterium]